MSAASFAFSLFVSRNLKRGEGGGMRKEEGGWAQRPKSRGRFCEIEAKFAPSL